MRKMGKQHKKLIAVAAAAAAACALAAVAVFAYLTDNDDMENRIRIGYDESKIVEEFTPFSMQEGINIYKKKVQVENTGNTPCFARVYVDFSDDEIRKNSFLAYSTDTEETAIDALLENGHAIFAWDSDKSQYVLKKGEEVTTLSDLESNFDFYSALHKLTVTSAENTELLTLKTDSNSVTHNDIKVESDHNDTKTYAAAVNTVAEIAPNWVFMGDADSPSDEDAILGGYYYYTKPLAAGEKTPPLFTYIKTVTDEVKAFDIQVYAESVQTVDSDGNDQSAETDGYKTIWKDFLSSVS